MRNGSGFWDGDELQGAELRTGVNFPRYPVPQSAIRNPRFPSSAIRNPRFSAFRNPQSAIPFNPQSAIRDSLHPQSAIRDSPHSAFRNPQSPSTLSLTV
jgi:hypothetical protein